MQHCSRPCCNVFLILSNFLVNRILIGYLLSSWLQLFWHFKLFAKFDFSLFRSLTITKFTSGIYFRFNMFANVARSLKCPVWNRKSNQISNFSRKKVITSNLVSKISPVNLQLIVVTPIPVNRIFYNLKCNRQIFQPIRKLEYFPSVNTRLSDILSYPCWNQNNT